MANYQWLRVGIISAIWSFAILKGAEIACRKYIADHPDEPFAKYLKGEISQDEVLRLKNGEKERIQQ